MANFTPVVHGLDWQSVDFLNELVKSFNERVQAAKMDIDNGGPITLLPDVAAGDDIQLLDFWTAMQSGLEAVVNKVGTQHRFIDHDATITGPGGSIAFYTLSSWRAKAGLDASGFRRARVFAPPAAPTWLTPGIMQVDGPDGIGSDIIGFWIFEDLQLGLDALKYTATINSAADVSSPYYNEDVIDAIASKDGSAKDYGTGFSTPPWTPNCDAARAACKSQFETAWATPPSATRWYWGAGVLRSWRYDYDFGPGQWFIEFTASRRECVFKISDIPVIAGIAFDWDFYVYPEGTVDIDSTGYPISEYSLFKSDTGASGAEVVLDDYLFPIDTFPHDIDPTVDCPNYGIGTQDFFVTIHSWVMKWDFSFALP